jgi:hypothetical protein
MEKAAAVFPVVSAIFEEVLREAQIVLVSRDPVQFDQGQLNLLVART